MTFQLKECNEGKAAAVHISGELANSDCGYFVPEFDRLIGLFGEP